MEQDGGNYFLIKDPRQMAKQALIVRQELGAFLAHADGTLAVEQIISAVRTRTGSDVQDSAVKDLFEQLDKFFLLEGERYESEVARKLNDYRAGEFRAPALEGQAYPDEPDDLLDMLEGFAPDIPDDQQPTGQVLKAIVSPHIDFARGGDTYAEVWRAAAPDLEDVELAVVFGTDHYGSGPRLTLTRQSYATPWNILPNDADLVTRLARVLKPDPTCADHPFADEFNHTYEHSIELATVWLNWAVGDRAVKVLPVLCGSLGNYVLEDGPLRGESPADHTQIADAIGLLQQVAQHRRTVFVASADLSHVGPAFGDEDVVDEETRKEIEEHDSALMTSIVRGDQDTFLETVRREDDFSRVCGLAPLYMALWAAGATEGRWMGYQQCPADGADNSFVSVAGALLY